MPRCIWGIRTGKRANLVWRENRSKGRTRDADGRPAWDLVEHDDDANGIGVKERHHGSCCGGIMELQGSCQDGGSDHGAVWLLRVG